METVDVPDPLQGLRQGRNYDLQSQLLNAQIWCRARAPAGLPAWPRTQFANGTPLVSRPRQP